MSDTLADNLQRLTASRPAIANAIIAKGGTVNDGDGFEDFPNDINTIPTGSSSTLIPKTITENGTYNPSDDSADGYSSVVANVPNTYVAGDEGKVVNNGALVAQTAMSGEITVNDTYDTTLYNSITVNVAEPTPAPEPGLVRFMDYDGTILHTYTDKEFLALSAMPENPTHEGLTSQGWNWTLADAKEYVRNNENIDIGASYITDDGATRYYLTLTEDRKEPVLTLYLKANTTLDIDWGDGSPHSTFSTTSAGFVDERHTYASAGDYVISISAVSGSYILQTKVASYSTIISDNKSGVQSSNSAYLTAVRKIEIGDNVELYSYAFHQYTNLETITIPHGIEAKLCKNCFQNCYKLKSVIIPSDATSETNGYQYIFQNCYGLKNVSFPNNAPIPNVSYLFQGCYSLERICLPIIDNTTSSYGQYAFSGCSKLKHVVLPYGTTTISGYMFENCYSIIEIKLPSTLTKIQQYAFSGCSSLRSIKIPPSVVFESYCFRSCTSLREVEFEEGLEDLTGSTLFNDCGIKTIKFPSTLTRISGTQIFYGTQIETVELPDTIESIGSGLFTRCLLLKSCNIPSKLTSISDYMFDHCSSLEYLEIPAHITSIGNNAFSSCSSLMNIKLNEGLESIGNYTFASCTALEKVDFPDSLKSIGANTFSYCTSLDSVRFPDTLESFYFSSNFDNCSSLKSVDINTISASGNANSIFSSCYSLSHVSINKVTTLETYAFYRCFSLKRLTIPATVTSIGSSALSGLSDLEELKFEGSTPPTMYNTGSYGNLPTTCKILVPAGSLEAYTTAAKYPSPSTYTYEEY